MDGSLDAYLPGTGHHQIQISQLNENSSIRIGGHGSHLVLKVPDPCTFGIRINAKSIAVPEKMTEHQILTQFEYQTENSDCVVIEVNAENGRVVVEHQDWLASLGIGFSNK